MRGFLAAARLLVSCGRERDATGCPVSRLRRADEVIEVSSVVSCLLCDHKTIKCKKLISLQHGVRAMKSHIQNSTDHFFSGIM